jgi:hypothetical protein
MEGPGVLGEAGASQGDRNAEEECAALASETTPGADVGRKKSRPGAANRRRPLQGPSCYRLVGEEATFSRAEAKLFRSWLIDELQIAAPSPERSRPSADTSTT